MDDDPSIKYLYSEHDAATMRRRPAPLGRPATYAESTAWSEAPPNLKFRRELEEIAKARDARRAQHVSQV